MTKPEWGTKRICDSCGKRFYDLKRNPILCPQCGTTVTARKTPTKTPKAVAAAPVEAKPEKPVVPTKPAKADSDGPWADDDVVVVADDGEEIADLDVDDVDDSDDDDDLDEKEGEDLLVDASDLDEDEDELDVVKVRLNDAGDD